jgi:hypothetical protein
MSRIFEMNTIMQRLNNEGGNEEGQPGKRSLLDSFLYNPHGSHSIHRSLNKPASFLKLFPSNYDQGQPFNLNNSLLLNQQPTQ